MTWRPDGDVRYRTGHHGERIGIIPRRCKRRRHDLAVTGYTARVTKGADQHPRRIEDYLVVTCTACSDAPHPDHSWTLILTGDAPARAEMDDDPYADIRPHYIAIPVRPVTD